MPTRTGRVYGNAQWRPTARSHGYLSQVYARVCDYTGLIGQYDKDVVERTWALTNSVEAQSAVVVALRMALEAGEDLDQEGWKRVWSIIFELRDLKVVPPVFRESDLDFLNEMTRSDWNMEYDVSGSKGKEQKRTSSVFCALGRALFGSDDGDRDDTARHESGTARSRSAHGKEDAVIWDELAASDDVDYGQGQGSAQAENLGDSLGVDVSQLSSGALFEAQSLS